MNHLNVVSILPNHHFTMTDPIENQEKQKSSTIDEEKEQKRKKKKKNDLCKHVYLYRGNPTIEP